MIEKEEVDYLIVGEGEAPLVELLDALENNHSIENIRIVWSKNNGKLIKNTPRPLMPPDTFPKVD